MDKIFPGCGRYMWWGKDQQESRMRKVWGRSSSFETEGATTEEYEEMTSGRWWRWRHGQPIRAFREEHIFWWHLGFSLVELIGCSDPWNCKLIHVCFKLQGLGTSLLNSTTSSVWHILLWIKSPWLGKFSHHVSRLLCMKIFVEIFCLF